MNSERQLLEFRLLEFRYHTLANIRYPNGEPSNLKGVLDRRLPPEISPSCTGVRHTAEQCR